MLYAMLVRLFVTVTNTKGKLWFCVHLDVGVQELPLTKCRMLDYIYSMPPSGDGLAESTDALPRR